MPNLRMIGRGKKVTDLYILEADSSNSIVTNCNPALETFNSVCSVISNVTPYTCHNRLGHLSFQKLELLRDQLHLSGDELQM